MAFVRRFLDIVIMNVIEGTLETVQNKTYAVIVGRFNGFISEQLLQGAVDCLRRHGVDESRIEVFRIPGSYEIPGTLKKLADLRRYDAIICLGVLIRGATPHFEHIAGFVAKAIGQISIDSGTPAIFGVLTTDTIEQAVERAGTKSGNKGWDAALAAIEMASLYHRITELSHE